MCLRICVRHAAAVVRLSVGIRDEETFPWSLFFAAAHPVPTTAVALAIIRILVRGTVTRDGDGIFVGDGRGQGRDALEPLTGNPPAVAVAQLPACRSVA